MIRVIHKAFDIIELLAREKQGKKLNEICSRLKMNAGTCANILKTMRQRKFVEQRTKRGAYMLGPMVYYLARLNTYHGDLVAVSEKPMAELASAANETVLIAILRGHERFVVMQIDGKQSVQVGPGFFEKDTIYRTATGRLLLAYLDEKEIKSFIAEQGLPGPDWPAANSPSRLEAALGAIRRQGWVCHTTVNDITGIAYPIRENDRVIAALGLFLPAFRFKGSHKTKIMKGMSIASAAISARLSADFNEVSTP